MSSGHSHGSSHESRLVVTLVLVVAYMIAEVIGGLWTNSLALLADAGHMLSDAGALIASIIALRIAKKPASRTHTFGYRRAEILAALGNAATLLAIAAYILFEAVQRFRDPPEVQGFAMLLVATGGLVINIVGLFLLHAGREESLNVRGAWLHVMGDALGSVGAIVSGALIMAFGWGWADPLASVLIAILVVYSGWALLKESVRVLMQAVPERLELAALREALLALDGVETVTDLHVWSITSEREILSVHLSVSEGADGDRLLHAAKSMLASDFDIRHSTVQIDYANCQNRGSSDDACAPQPN